MFVSEEISLGLKTKDWLIASTEPRFPVHIAWAAIIATLLFICAQFYLQIYNRQVFRNLTEVQFPIVERNSINLRLHEKLSSLVEVAVSKNDPSLFDEYNIFTDALSQNLELTEYTLQPLNGSSDTPSLPDRVELEEIEGEIFKELREGHREQALSLFNSERYLNAGDAYTGALQEISEGLSTQRDDLLSRQNQFLTVGMTLSILVFALAAVFWALVMQSYTSNLRLKSQAEALLKEEQARTIQASKLSTLGEMAAGVAHEINNPLTIIQGYAEILSQQAQRDKLEKAQLLKITDGIVVTTARIAKIVRSLRTYARDDSGASLIPAKVSNIVDDTLSLCQEKLKNKNIVLSYQPPERPLWVSCREVQISQVLLNLLQNSMDAIESQPADKWIRVEIEPSEGVCRIRVTDSGNGIPESIREKILQPFFTTKEIGKGTGLGLSISRNILKEHNGRFYYDETQTNTSFVAELPLISTPPAHGPVAPPAAAS